METAAGPVTIDKERQLRRMKRIPLLLLFLMALLFAATLHAPAPWAGGDP